MTATPAIKPGDKAFQEYEIVRPLDDDEMVDGQLINNLRRNKFWAKICVDGKAVGDPILLCLDNPRLTTITGYTE